MQGWRKSLAFASLIAALGVLAFAATLASAHSTTTKAGSLNIMGFGTGDDVAESRAAIATKAAGATVNRPSGGFNDQQFLAAVASGNPPDLVYLDRQKVGTYAAKGAFVPLTSCIKSQKISTKQYRIPGLNEVTYKGQIYGIPEFYDVRTILVDNNVLDQAGVKLSGLDTSNWPRLPPTAEKLAKIDNGKVTRIGFDPKIPEFFPLWAKANGVDILSKDGLHPHLNDPRAVAALQYAVGLINAQGGWDKFKSFRDTWDFFGAGNQVAKDQVGAWPMEDWYYTVMASTSPNVHPVSVPFRNLKGGIIN